MKYDITFLTINKGRLTKLYNCQGQIMIYVFIHLFVERSLHFEWQICVYAKLHIAYF